MHSSDKKGFGEMLISLLEIYDRKLSPGTLELWWRSLAPYSLVEVQGAMSAYLADTELGRYPATPAGVLGKLVRADGRPSPDEAWAIAVASQDEADTVCWTAEIAEASGASAPIMALGDKVGARMAFLAAYGRLVELARQAGRPVVWSLSLGTDRARRAAAAERVVRLGLMPPEEVAHLLPSPEAQGPIADLARLLAGKVVAHPAKADGEYRRRMTELREALVGAGEARAPGIEDGLSAGDREILAALERRA